MSEKMGDEVWVRVSRTSVAQLTAVNDAGVVNAAHMEAVFRIAREAITSFNQGYPENGVKTVAAASSQYANDDLVIDDNAPISKGHNGTWVQAWVWVADGDDECACAHCGQPIHINAESTPSGMMHPQCAKLHREARPEDY